jgi:four helix bundle protein
MRRSAVSIASNVAEGHNRRTNRPYRNHVLIALGSQGKFDTLVELALRLRFITQAVAMITRVGQMLSGLARSLKADDDED